MRGETKGAMEGDKRGQGSEKKDEEERCREEEKEGWRERLKKKVGRQKGGRGPKCKKEQSVET